MNQKKTRVAIVALIAIFIVSFFYFDLGRFFTLEYFKGQQQALPQQPPPMIAAPGAAPPGPPQGMPAPIAAALMAPTDVPQTRSGVQFRSLRYFQTPI